MRRRVVAKIETSVEIARPVAEVWEYLTDLRNEKEWSTEVVDTTYSGPIQLGATGTDTRRWGKKVVKWDWKVTAYEAPRRLTLTFGPPMNAVADFTFEPTTQGTRLTCTTTLKPSGWTRLIAPLIAAEGRSADQKQFAKAKEILESRKTG
jgi:uncharacterized protein YndB with AHSA1/START domain